MLSAEDKGIVKRILVQEGQQVKEGDLLMELDRTMSESNLNALKKEISYYDINIRRIMAELSDKPFLTEAGADEFIPEPPVGEKGEAGVL